MITVPEHRRPQTYTVAVLDAHGHVMHAVRGPLKGGVHVTHKQLCERYDHMQLHITHDSYRECTNCEGQGRVGRYGCPRCEGRGEVLTEDYGALTERVAAFLNEAAAEHRALCEDRPWMTKEV